MTETLCEGILQRSRQHTKIQLASIAKIDKQLTKIIHQYDTLTVYFLDLLKHKNAYQDSTFQLNELIQKIEAIQQQMDQLSAQKVRLANSLHCSVSSDCQQMDKILGDCEEYQQFLAENEEKTMVSEEEAEMQQIFQECRNQEYLDLCICSPEQKEHFTANDLMIMCEAPECSKRWYHLKCLGLTEKASSSSESWLCPQCQNDKNIKAKIE